MDICDRIFDLVDKQYSEQQVFASDLGVSTTMVSAWRKRKSESYMKRIPQIAELLGTTAEYLLMGETKESSPPEPASKPAMMAAFWGGDKDLSQEDLDDMWADVEKFAAFVAEKKKQEKRRHD